jgi:hypothetical protein
MHQVALSDQVLYQADGVLDRLHIVGRVDGVEFGVEGAEVQSSSVASVGRPGWSQSPSQARSPS